MMAKKPVLTDEEFEAVMKSKLSGSGEILNSYDFTHDQTTTLCVCCASSSMPSGYVITLVSGEIMDAIPLTTEHIDILLHSDYEIDPYQVFLNGCLLEPHQIEFGLNHDTPNIRVEAYNHPCCTDEQKVKYHLKWGYDFDR